jgi:transcriptional regulator with XRE-family HTH domain
MGNGMWPPQRGILGPMVDTNAAIAKRLARLRSTMHLSQADMCRRIGVAPNRWNQYETGTRRITVEVVSKLRDTFGVTSDWVFFGDESGLPRRITDHFLDAAE